MPLFPRLRDLSSRWFPRATVDKEKPPPPLLQLEDELASNLGALKFEETPPTVGEESPDLPPQTQGAATFVGGFHPKILLSQAADPHAGMTASPLDEKKPSKLDPCTPERVPVSMSMSMPMPMPMPIPMPIPSAAEEPSTKHFISKALGPDTSEDSPSDVISAPQLGSLEDSFTVSETITKPRSSAPHKATPRKQRSAPPSPAKIQCSGHAKTKGRQCSRQVELPATYSHLDPTPVLYCHDHKRLTSSGVFVRKSEAGSTENFIKFSHYIRGYLQVDTQLALRAEMEKLPSAFDTSGYIYVFEIRDPERPDVIQLKVGSAINLNKRIDQWDKQCGSKEHILRGYWPEVPGSLLKGNVDPGDPGPFCRRVERLVHIELADLALHAPYLEPNWPDQDTTDQSAKAGMSARSKKAPIKECADCGVVHREIFTFTRPDEGEYKGNEWDLIIKPVIKKWGEFVREYYA